MELAKKHRHSLETESSISPEVIEARGYVTATTKASLRKLGFHESQCSVPALLIPVYSVSGEIATYQIRPDQPRINKGKAVKYETPQGTKMVLDIHPMMREKIGDPTIPLIITEGIKKGDSATCRGLCSISLLGVWNWRGTNPDGGISALPDWEYVALKGHNDNRRTVYLCFDSDVMTKPEVYQALCRLSEFLKRRGAKVLYIYLPHGNDGRKVGMDDYFAAGHTKEDLLNLASSTLRESEREQRERPCSYSITPGGTFWNKPGDGGTVSLANFSARIISDVTEDDGAETHRIFTLEANLNGRTIPFDIPAATLPGMNWVTERIGARAIVYPGQGTKDHFRTAIQTLSDPDERRVRSHTGWFQTEDGKWAYAHAGGTIGTAEQTVEVKLSQHLRLFHLPDPPQDPAILKEAVVAVLRLLKLGKEITAPLVAAVFRSVLGPCDFSLFLVGPTGVFKSELAALAQQFFGPGMTSRNLTANWSSTDNTLEAQAFAAKDAVLVIDEFVPRGGQNDRERHHAKADRVLRAQGNHSGRGRMRADGTLRPDKPPRGLIISTGEDTPIGQSLRARMVVLEMEAGDIPSTDLTRCQQDAASGQYALVLSAFLADLAPRYGEVLEGLPQEVAEIRGKLKADWGKSAHRRTPENACQLMLGFRRFVLFAFKVGALSEEEAKRVFAEGRDAILRAMQEQEQHQEDSDPTRRFLELLRAAIASKCAHITGKSGNKPEDAQAWGWTRTEDEHGFPQRWQAHGERIGFLDGEDLYLIPDVAYKVAQKTASDNGSGIPLRPQTLWKRLSERGLLASRDEKRQRNTTRITIDGNRHDVLHLLKSTVFPPESAQPSLPTQPDNYREDAALSSEEK